MTVTSGESLRIPGGQVENGKKRYYSLIFQTEMLMLNTCYHKYSFGAGFLY